ncbi:MAG: Iron-sulfur cluster-binding protein [uncultured Acidimicrobiales bacterium]|uniref:Iron-sulfur cluster-binding protein n=1 Tax=uncultured Acidimicrobiales bacterium TaxID=310071 RepID=A0A6J4HJ07_9ACTN|nr:MAG: Iron-sulfur cluster-binding protein [uncultured Acidimicrobiales bacterium]
MSEAPDAALTDEVISVGRSLGLDAVGIAPSRPFESARAVLEERKAAGLHGGMQFTYRNPARSTDPQRALEGARAIVVGARSYRRADATPVDRGGGGVGVVARYSWEDHYAPLREALAGVAAGLEQRGWRAKVLVDDNALVDREAAYRAGLGWYGKNANLLIPGRGSWFVLGSVVTDAPLVTVERPASDGCGSCSRCMPACPTGALGEPGVLDARRCLAWLLEAPGAFPEEHRAALGGRIYGCDECQEVCPPNSLEIRRRPPPAPGTGAEAHIDLLWLLEADDSSLLQRVGRWYIPGRDPRYIRRNALVALGNVGDGKDATVAGTLARYLGSDDELLREHAAWAAARLGRADLVR